MIEGVIYDRFAVYGDELREAMNHPLNHHSHADQISPMVAHMYGVVIHAVERNDTASLPGTNQGRVWKKRTRQQHDPMTMLGKARGANVLWP